MFKEQCEKGGNLEKCVVFKWFEIFFEFDDEKFMECYCVCKVGELICGQCKCELIECVQKFFKEYQKKRKEVEKKVEKFKYIGEFVQEQWDKVIFELLRI